jgi:hypothetical protein
MGLNILLQAGHAFHRIAVFHRNIRPCEVVAAYGKVEKTATIADRFLDLLQARHDGRFQRRAIRRRRVRAVEPLDRRVEVVERSVDHLRGNLRADSARGEGLVDDQ